MPQKRDNILPGLILIALGIIFLLPQLTNLRMHEIWPLFTIGVGAAFFFFFFMDRSNYGLILPGTILIVSGGLFFYCIVEGWYVMGHLWPIFLIATGLGFALMYLLGKKDRGLLIPASIVGGMGFLFLLGPGKFFWPLTLIAIGVIFLLSALRKQR